MWISKVFRCFPSYCCCTTKNRVLQGGAARCGGHSHRLKSLYLAHIIIIMQQCCRRNVLSCNMCADSYDLLVNLIFYTIFEFSCNELVSRQQLHSRREQKFCQCLLKQCNSEIVNYLSLEQLTVQVALLHSPNISTDRHIKLLKQTSPSVSLQYENWQMIVDFFFAVFPLRNKMKGYGFYTCYSNYITKCIMNRFLFVINRKKRIHK